MKMFDVEQVKALNDLERMVYEYVVKDPEKVKYMRIRELADEVHVSTSTILRFCKKMGCSGYSEFKLQLRDYQTRKDQANVRDDISEVVDFLKKTAAQEFEDKLEMLAEVIFHANHVFLVGSGMSGIVAKYGARYFSSMGKFCLYSGCVWHQYLLWRSESSFLKDSLVIVFSVSGESGDTIRHVMRFKEQNCRILSITNTENCTIAKLSDHNIAYYVSYMRLGDYDVTTQIPAVSIVERLGKKLYRYTSKGPGAI